MPLTHNQSLFGPLSRKFLSYQMQNRIIQDGIASPSRSGTLDRSDSSSSDLSVVFPHLAERRFGGVSRSISLTSSQGLSYSSDSVANNFRMNTSDEEDLSAYAGQALDISHVPSTSIASKLLTEEDVNDEVTAAAAVLGGLAAGISQSAERDEEEEEQVDNNSSNNNEDSFMHGFSGSSRSFNESAEKNLLSQFPLSHSNSDSYYSMRPVQPIIDDSVNNNSSLRTVFRYHPNSSYNSSDRLMVTNSTNSHDERNLLKAFSISVNSHSHSHHNLNNPLLPVDISISSSSHSRRSNKQSMKLSSHLQEAAAAAAATEEVGYVDTGKAGEEEIIMIDMADNSSKKNHGFIANNDSSSSRRSNLSTMSMESFTRDTLQGFLGLYGHDDNINNSMISLDDHTKQMLMDCFDGFAAAVILNRSTSNRNSSKRSQQQQSQLNLCNLDQQSSSCSSYSMRSNDDMLSQQQEDYLLFDKREFVDHFEQSKQARLMDTEARARFEQSFLSAPLFHVGYPAMGLIQHNSGQQDEEDHHHHSHSSSSFMSDGGGVIQHGLAAMWHSAGSLLHLSSGHHHYSHHNHIPHVQTQLQTQPTQEQPPAVQPSPRSSLFWPTSSSNSNPSSDNSHQQQRPDILRVQGHTGSGEGISSFATVNSPLGGPPHKKGAKRSSLTSFFNMQQHGSAANNSRADDDEEQSQASNGAGSTVSNNTAAVAAAAAISISNLNINYDPKTVLLLPPPPPPPPNKKERGNYTTATAATSNSQQQRQQETRERGAYRCSRCGKIKADHICEFVVADRSTKSRACQVYHPIYNIAANCPLPGEKFLVVNGRGAVYTMIDPAVATTAAKVEEEKSGVVSAKITIHNKQGSRSINLMQEQDDNNSRMDDDDENPDEGEEEEEGHVVDTDQLDEELFYLQRQHAVQESTSIHIMDTGEDVEISANQSGKFHSPASRKSTL